MKTKSEGINLTQKATLETRYAMTRKLIDGSLFSESDLGLLGLLKESLSNREKRELLFDIFGDRAQTPLPLSEIIKVLEKFENLSKTELTKEDIKLINFTIKYIEGWFYSGEWAKISHKQNQQEHAYAYFSVPAGIVNMITKFKDSNKSKDEIVGFDKNQLAKIQKEVELFAQDYLASERLETLLKENLNQNKREKIQFLYEHRVTILSSFLESQKLVKAELEGGKGTSGSKASDLYLIKTSLIAAEMARRSQILEGNHYVFNPGIITGKDEYELFDFSQGKDEYSSMHYPTNRIIFNKFLVEYFRTRKNK